MTDTPFTSDLRDLLRQHDIEAPRFAYGHRAFDRSKPKLYYSGPFFDQAELIAAIGSLVEGYWSVAGENVNRFEREFGAYIHQKHNVMVNSGSSADLLMIAAAKKVFGWNDGDGIIVSPVGFPTTISAIVLNGLHPVFVDVEMETLNFDLNHIERVLGEERAKSSYPLIRAILLSPVLGNPPNMGRLSMLAARFGVPILLDGCDSLGTCWNGHPLSIYCAASTCSFFPAHHISTLQGGMISSDNECLVETARSMATWGRQCFCKGAGNLLPNGTCGKRFSPWLKEGGLDIDVDHRYTYGTSSAYNLLPLDLQGAIGLVQMEKLEEIHALRRIAHREVWAALSAIPEIRTVSSPPSANVSWFGVPIICPNYEFKRRLVAHLEGTGVQTRNYFAGNILLHPGYSHLGEHAAYPNADQVLGKTFFLGCPPFYGPDHFVYLREVVGRWIEIDRATHTD